MYARLLIVCHPRKLSYSSTPPYSFASELYLCRPHVHVSRHACTSVDMLARQSTCLHVSRHACTSVDMFHETANTAKKKRRLRMSPMQRPHDAQHEPARCEMRAEGGSTLSEKGVRNSETRYCKKAAEAAPPRICFACTARMTVLHAPPACLILFHRMRQLHREMQMLNEVKRG